MTFEAIEGGGLEAFIDQLHQKLVEGATGLPRQLSTLPGNTDVDKVHVFERYRFAFIEVLDVNGDVLYQDGQLKDGDEAKGGVSQSAPPSSS